MTAIPSRMLALCQEYGHGIQIIDVASNRPRAYSLLVKGKYFRELFDRMRTLGYVCASTSREGARDGYHRVTFSPSDVEYDFLHDE